jgi:hypothetical protein
MSASLDMVFSLSRMSIAPYMSWWPLGSSMSLNSILYKMFSSSVAETTSFECDHIFLSRKLSDSRGSDHQGQGTLGPQFELAKAFKLQDHLRLSSC